MEHRVVVGNLGAFYASGIDPTDSACIGTTTLYHKETPVMQYIGLKDKNGKEVYEGDILLNHSAIPSKPMVVEFMRCGFMLHSEKYDTNIEEEDEIIGNIHQNPDLLTGLR